MSFKEKIFFKVKEIIEEEKDFYLTKAFLSFLSWPVYFYFSLKNFLYDKKILQPVKVPAKVISIGNIVAGGTGKTPFTIFLAQKLIDEGIKVAIVSRGYGAMKRKKKEVFIIPVEANLDPRRFGDEPILISSRVPQAKIFVGNDKIFLAKKASSFADVILLDDGFQSRYLHRDLDIVLVDSSHPFSNGKFLPRGLLRDFPKSLQRADLIVATNPKEEKKILPRAEKIPIIYFSSYLSCFKDLSKNKVSLLPDKIGAFCAIANPKNFYNSLEEKGFELVEKFSLFDHSTFTIPQLISFSKVAKEKGAKVLICTEKDMVKLPRELSLPLLIYYAEQEFKMIDSEKKLEELLSQLGFYTISEK
jgi:tetraacyldisaccharide 4'-kinase